MKNHHEVGHFKNRLMIVLLSLFSILVMAGQSFAATTCSSCHEMPPVDSADGSRQPSTGAFKGSHQKHMGATATADECTKCHGNSGYTSDHSKTSGNMIQMNANINNSFGGTYDKPAPFAQSSVPAMETCSNVNCHFERNTTDRTPAPVWGDATLTVDCNTCHATPRASSGSHAKHEALFTCDQCHPSYGTTNFSHATSAGKARIKLHATLAYDGGTATSWLQSQPKQYGSCTTNTCHDNGQGVVVTTPIWGDSVAACSACHDAVPATRTHTKHLSGLASGFTRNAVCADCHKNYVQGTTTDPAKHLDGNVDVYYATVGDLGYPGVNPKGDTPNSCSTSYCHSNGRSTFATVAWGSTNSAGCTFCHPNLNGKHSSHINTTTLAAAVYGSTADNSAVATYDFGCGNCHPTSASNHINNTVDLTLNSTHGGSLKSKNDTTTDNAGYTQNAGVSVTCAAAYCHSNGMATPTYYGASVNWYEASYSGDKCARCHGNSPNTGGKVGSNAHKAHVVGIHVEDIFNGVSKKMPIGGGNAVNAAHGRNNRSTTINCNICHALTVTAFENDENSACTGCHDNAVAPFKGNASIADKSKHVNGTVDISFINQKIATKAQLANSAFAGYTAANAGGWSRNSNGMPFKTYTSSYDVSKSALLASASWSDLAGCANVACHNGKTVKWTDTVTCTSCHTRLK